MPQEQRSEEQRLHRQGEVAAARAHAEAQAEHEAVEAQKRKPRQRASSGGPMAPVLDEAKALGGMYADKQAARGANKADLEGLSKDELEAIAAARGVKVTRADGRTDLQPLVSDYLRALAG